MSLLLENYQSDVGAGAYPEPVEAAREIFVFAGMARSCHSKT
jgi:hypothetical protein